MKVKRRWGRKVVNIKCSVYNHSFNLLLEVARRMDADVVEAST